MFIKASSTASFAEEYIVESIWNGKFPPGSILPAERELSELIGVTRTTLREVLQRLARDGWLTIQHGKPTKVNNFWETSGLNILETLVRLDSEGTPQMLDNLLSARTNVSTIYIRSAFKSAPEKAFAAFEKLEALEDDAMAFANFDYRLHHDLAFASGNSIYVLILNGFKGLYSRIGEFYFNHQDARDLARKQYKELRDYAKSGNYQDVHVLLRGHGIASGELFNKYKENMPEIE